MKKHLIYILFFGFTINVNAQELLCNVRVNSSQVQTSDRKIFQTMQTSIYEFVNNKKWTTTNVQNEERIECTIMINISKQISNDEFEGSLQIQSTRPVFGTSYKSSDLALIGDSYVEGAGDSFTSNNYKYSIGQPFIYPDNTLDYSGNFLKMVFGVPAEKYVVNRPSIIPESPGP